MSELTFIVAAASVIAIPALAEMKSPETSALFDKFIDPVSGVESYVLKSGLVGAWHQQGLYFTAKSMTDDGRFLLFDVADDERMHPVTNYIDAAKTKAFVDFVQDKAFVLPDTDGGIPFFDTKTARLYYIRRDKSKSVPIATGKDGRPLYGAPFIPSVFMRDFRTDPFREVKLCNLPTELHEGITCVQDYYTHLTLTKDRKKAFLAVKGDVDWRTWKGKFRHGLLDLETGHWEEWGTSDYYLNHDQLCPADDSLALVAHDRCWMGLGPGETYPRLHLRRPNGNDQMVPPVFCNFATHESWNAQGTGFTYGSYNCSYYDLKSGKSEVYCPLRADHPSVSSDNRYVLVDVFGGERWWRGCSWRVGMWDRCTSQYVNIFANSGEIFPFEPRDRRCGLHPDAHPAFNCNDRYIVSTYNLTNDTRMAVMVTPVAPIRKRLAANNADPDGWDLAFATTIIAAEAKHDAKVRLAERRFRQLIETRTGTRMGGAGRVFVFGWPPPGVNAAKPGEGCARAFGGKVFLYGDIDKAVDLISSCFPSGNRRAIKDGWSLSSNR